MPTADEIRGAEVVMEPGWYVDRRGRRWRKNMRGRWVHLVAIGDLGLEYVRRTHDQMRLMIIRDAHREIGCSPRDCKFHPVPVVAKVWGDGWFASRPGYRNEEIYPTLAEAFAAAERLATGENQ